MKYDDVTAAIAKNLASLFEEKGIATTALGPKIGLGRTTLRDIISGKSKDPKYITLLKVADYVGVDVRRITIGPHYEDLDAELAEWIQLYWQLEPAERRFVLKRGGAPIDAEDRSQQPPSS